MKRTALVFLLLTIPAFPKPDAEDTIRRAQKVWSGLKSLAADFINTHYSSTVAVPLIEKGRIWLKKPAYMRWDYRELEEKIFLVRGNSYLMYVPEDNQLYRGAIDSEGRQGDILKILSGRKDILETYSAEEGPAGEEDSSIHRIKLTPHVDDDFSFIMIDIDKKSFLIKRIIFFDWTDSRQEISFSRIRTDIPVSDELFSLKVPPDVEIIDY